MTSQDFQLLQLVHQVQSHQVSNIRALLLGISMSLPVSTPQKLNIYHRLSSLPISEISPLQLTLLITLGPVGLVALFFILILLFRWIISTGIPVVLSRIGNHTTEKKLLQLTFPADTGKSAFATEELYRLLHTLSRQLTFWDSVMQRKNEYSLEIVSTKQDGIRYLLAAQPKFIDIISRNLLSYLPGIKITEVGDYLDSYLGNDVHKRPIGLIELKLSSHFALPLETQKTLSESDPISYLTGNMTKLIAGELISCQVIVSPVISSIHRDVTSEITNLRQRIYKGQPLTEAVQKNAFQKYVSLPLVSVLWFLIKSLWKIVSFAVMFVYSMAIGLFDTSGKSVPFFKAPTVILSQEILNPYEKELSEIIKTKIDQQLFETSIRILVVSPNPDEVSTRINGLLASFGQLGSPYQTFTVKKSLFPSHKNALNLFKLRQLSQSTSVNPNPILSTSEISDLYHFPFTDTTKTEGLVKLKSRELPAPLSFKKSTAHLDVMVGKNLYGGEETPVGLTHDQRREQFIGGEAGNPCQTRGKNPGIAFTPYIWLYFALLRLFGV